MSDEVNYIPGDKSNGSQIQDRSDGEDYADVEDNGEGFVSTGRNLEEYKTGVLNFGVRFDLKQQNRRRSSNSKYREAKKRRTKDHQINPNTRLPARHYQDESNELVREESSKFNRQSSKNSTPLDDLVKNDKSDNSKRPRKDDQDIEAGITE